MKHVLRLGAILLTASLARAQDRETTTTTTTTQVTKVSNVMGGSVVLQSETLGKVTDIVINDHGCIDYLVVSYGEEYVAVPWGAVRYDTRQQTITVTSQINRQQLRDLTFAGNRWPSFRDQSWSRNMRSVWGANAFRSEGRTGVRDSGAGTEDRHSGTTPDPKRTDTNREGSGTNREGTGTTRPGAGTNKEGATRPGDGTSRDTPPRSGGGANKEGNTRPGGTTNPGTPRPGGTNKEGSSGANRDAAPDVGSDRRGPTDPGLPRQNQRQDAGNVTPGAIPFPRRPGVDETRNIGNGVNTNPNPTTSVPIGPAGTTTGNTPGPSNTNANAPRTTTPRTTDRPPQ